MDRFKVDNAIILAAGFGSRFVPISYETPKALVPVKGEPLVERQIRQLKEAGVQEIILVVGHLREKFTYLVEKYGVRYMYNPEYNSKNNLASLYFARRYLKNSYILSGDHYITENIFKGTEERSWLSCIYQPGSTNEWCAQSDPNDPLARIKEITIGGQDSWILQGPAFLSRPVSEAYGRFLRSYHRSGDQDASFWEQILIDQAETLPIHINKQEAANVLEFDSYEELRAFDPAYYQGNPDPLIETITGVFQVQEPEISDIKNYEAGMTNRSFGFTVQEKAYVFRLPGEGTENLISRVQESEVYDAIAALDVSDRIVHFDREKGYKISRYYENSRNTSFKIPDDVEKSMAILRQIHQSGITVGHSFDLEGEINRYHVLCQDRNCIRYKDIDETRAKMEVLIGAQKAMGIPHVLCHVDANPDNFIRLPDGTVKLVDWEYSGMADPLIDISMYSIYCYYSKSDMDELLRIYLQRRPTRDETKRLYIHTALGGYLWALWTEYKQSYGIEYGKYGLHMYRYAKNFYSHLQRGFL
ncbi:MAG: NTP transferase domain-containing protein [Treponema sp.]|nr:NTP transferase domain-containing protein [Treponema sp.]